MTQTKAQQNTDFLQDFAALSACGATAGGGVDRQAGTAADRHTRAWFADWLTSHGMTVRYDQIGNQFGYITWAKGAPYVLVGSHLDSQPMAGRFDGAYGVLAGAHAAHRLAQEVQEGRIAPQFNVAVVNWFNEEGSRFTPSMMGSSVFTGKLNLDTALQTTDRQDTSVAEELAAEGVPRDTDAPHIAAYAEIHVEQGRLLEDNQKTIGLVTNTWAAKKFTVTITGEQAHTGSTIMADRRDALYGAALVIVATREATDHVPHGALHSSVSELSLAPNSPVTLAREVVINLDLRSPEPGVIAEAENWLDAKISEIEAKAGVRIDKELTHEWDQLSYSADGIRLAREVVEGLRLPHQEIMTVAGHDSTNLKDMVPTVMLFVPSIEGISHNEAESTHDDDALAGVTALSAVLTRLVQGDLAATLTAVPGQTEAEK